MIQMVQFIHQIIWSDATNVAQIILNKGGQSINLIYVDDDNSNHSTTGYWMLLDNNFDFI